MKTNEIKEDYDKLQDVLNHAEAYYDICEDEYSAYIDGRLIKRLEDAMRNIELYVCDVYNEVFDSSMLKNHDALSLTETLLKCISDIWFSTDFSKHDEQIEIIIGKIMVIRTELTIKNKTKNKNE